MTLRATQLYQQTSGETPEDQIEKGAQMHHYHADVGAQDDDATQKRGRRRARAGRGRQNYESAFLNQQDYDDRNERRTMDTRRRHVGVQIQMQMQRERRGRRV